MNQQQLGKLGVSEAPPLPVEAENNTASTENDHPQAGYPLPLWVRFPADKGSISHKLDLLAWWLITTKGTGAAIADFLSRHKSTTLKTRVDNCRAWIWQHRYSAPEIRVALGNMPPSESEPLRAALNRVRAIIRNHTEDSTYE